MSPPSDEQHHRALGGWLLLGLRQLGVTGITVIGVVTLGRLLGPSNFALYGYTTTAMIVALGIGDFGLGSRIIRENPSNRQLGEIFGLQLGLLAILSAGLIAGLALAPLVGFTVHVDVPVVGCIGAATFLTLLQTIPTKVLERQMRFSVVGRIEVGQEFVFTGGAIAIALAGAKRLAIPASAIVAAIAAYVGTLWAAGWRARPRLAAPRRVLTRWSVDWWLGNVAGQFAAAALPVLAGLLLGSAAAGRVSLGVSITALATILAPLVARATFPAMVAASALDRVEVFARVFRTYLVASVPVLLVIVVGAREIVEIGFGPRWSGMTDLIRVMCLPAMIGLALTPCLPLLYLLLDPRQVRRTLLCWFAAQWILGVVGAELIGVAGLPLASFVAAGIATLRLDWLLRRASVDFGMFDEVLPALGVGSAAAAAGVGLMVLLRPGLASTSAGLAVAMTLYFAGLGERRRLLAPRQLLRSFGIAARTPLTSTASPGNR